MSFCGEDMGATRPVCSGAGCRCLGVKEGGAEVFPWGYPLTGRPWVMLPPAQARGLPFVDAYSKLCFPETGKQPGDPVKYGFVGHTPAMMELSVAVT